MKICTVDGCTYPVWSKGVCKKHAPKKPLKKSYPNPNHEEWREPRNRFFASIWTKRPHWCECCGRWLGTEPRTYMFDHILEKETYPELKFEEENIALVCLTCHSQKSNGYLTDFYKTKISFVKKKFNI